MQSPGITFAIWGPFARKNSTRRRAMNYAQPPANFAPIVSDKLAAFAEDQGMSLLRSSCIRASWYADHLISHFLQMRHK